MSTEPPPLPEAAPPAPAPAPAFAAPAFPPPASAPPAFPPQPEAAEPRPPRKPRTVLLLVSALLLGPLFGGGIGYAIQAGRPPTPLPPLQPTSLPQYPAGALAPDAAAAAAPKPLAIDGDLRKLLLPKPDGADDWDGFATSGDWESAGEMARSNGRPASAFEDLLQSGLRRAAVRSWQKDGIKYRVELIQYFPNSAGSAALAASLERSGASGSFGGGMEGAYQVATTPETYQDTTEKFYYASAMTRRGDVLVSVKVFASSSPVNADVVRDLGKQQWERLA